MPQEAAPAPWGLASDPQLWIVVLAAFLARLVLLYAHPGFSTGDDVELLEAAARIAYDLPYEPWAIRSLFIPYALIGPWLVLLRWFASLELGLTVVQLAVWPIAVVSSLSCAQVFDLGRRWGLSRRASLAASWIFGFHWLPLAYSSGAYTRPLATAAILAAAAIVSARRGLRSCLAAGFLTALAFTCRYSEVVFLLPLVFLGVLVSAGHRRVLSAAHVVAGFLFGVAVLVGGFDFVTWGHPFASLIEFGRYTLVERASSSLQAVQPWYWYMWRLAHWVPLSVLPLIVLGRRAMAARFSALFCVSAVVCLSLIHHEELRYLQVVVPFLALWAGSGVEPLLNGKRQVVAGVLLALTLAIGVQRAWSTTSRRSGAALQAAHTMGEGSPRKVVLSQAWAYGHLLLLGGAVGVADLPPVPTDAQLDQTLADADYVALYEDAIEARPSLAGVLQQAGCEHVRSFRVANSRAVVLFRGPHAAPR
jgi:hypothetical protein